MADYLIDLEAALLEIKELVTVNSNYLADYSELMQHVYGDMPDDSKLKSAYDKKIEGAKEAFSATSIGLFALGDLLVLLDAVAALPKALDYEEQSTVLAMLKKLAIKIIQRNLIFEEDKAPTAKDAKHLVELGDNIIGFPVKKKEK